MALGAFPGAITARHHGVARMFYLSTFGLMTGETNTLAHGIARSMNAMAIAATDPAHVVRTAAPVAMIFSIFVASQTGTIFVCRSGVSFFERLNLQGARIIILTGYL